MNLVRIAIPLACLGLATAALPAVAAQELTGSDSCAPIQKKAKQAAKSGKKAKAKRLKQRYKTCKSEATIRSALAGYTFTGNRGDGALVQVTLCDNGTWSSRIGSRPVAVSSGTTWVVRYPRFSSASKWVAQVAEYKDRNKGGWSVGFARSAETFEFGIASFDEVNELGPVSRAPAGTACTS